MQRNYPTTAGTNRSAWLAAVITVAVVTALALFLYPRSLERTMGLQELSPDDIAHMSITMMTSHLPEPHQYVQTQAFTVDTADEAFIEEVLSTLSGHRMRPRIGRGPHYYPLDPERPLGIEIIVFPVNTGERSRIHIYHSGRMVDVNFSGYVLYGDGIDTAKLMAAVNRLRDE